ncbi:MAG TPA: hypothetical protein V6C65_32705, partial [Allocoleopsis sp.]
MSDYQTEINQLANEIAQSKFWDKPRSREFVLRLADQITIPLAGWMVVRSCGVFEYCSPSSYGGPDDSFGIETYP